MSASDVPQSAIRFGEFALDVEAGELQRNGVKVRLQGQPLEILVLLLERPGRVVTRDELRQRLWPGDTFVDFEHGLNAAVNRLREALSDSAEGPRFIETVPRRGYRFIASTDQKPTEAAENKGATETQAKSSQRHLSVLWRMSLAAVVVIVGAALFFVAYKRMRNSGSAAQRVLRRLTFDDGLQIGATWSPDGRFIAYSSNRGGKFDIWLQQIGGGSPVQVTTGASQNWQPDWSPDGKYIAYRSERGAGGLYIVPAVGGAGQEQEISSFGYYPRWSPNSSQILFQSVDLGGMDINRFYVVGLASTAPREVLKELTAQNQGGLSAAWHPDGRRISAWVQGANGPPASFPTFWTVPVEGGTPVKSQILPETPEAKSTEPNWGEWRQDFKFSWAPSGRSIYFERTFQGARNLWRMTIDPESLRATGIERLTTGPETDTQLSVSADGKKLAFTGANEQVRAWLFPFDSNRAQVTGSGHPITSSGEEALAPSLSPDGSKLGFSTVRQDRWERWIKTISDKREISVPSLDSFARTFPTWSPDGQKIAYSRQELSTGKFDIAEWSPVNRKDESLANTSAAWCRVWDWSRDGKTLLLSQVNSEGDLNEIWALNVGAHPNESTEWRIASSRTHSLYQPQFSPDGRWIAFVAVRSNADGLESRLYAVSATGGAWIQLTDGKWDDKPRWSPDGRTIYFLSAQRGFFDLSGIRFDPVNGRRLGKAFLVKTFEDSSFMIPKNMVIVEISVTPNHLMVPLQQVSGGIWMLDNVDY